LCRDRGRIKVLDQHRVEIKLGVSYPRSMPEIRWITPVYHPNISEIGMVCLGGYGTHWVPSIQLDELCVMLWDMVRYHNYDIRSPYNRESAIWTAGQTNFRFPIDVRPLRDLRAAQGRTGSAAENDGADPGKSRAGARRSPESGSSGENPVSRVLQFIERYGRVFGDSNQPARRGAAGASGPPRSKADAGPGSGEVNASATVSAPAAHAEDRPGLPTPGPRTGVDNGHSEPTTSAPPVADLEPAADLLILDDGPDDGGQSDIPRHRVGDEEVVFID
jgi:hypothetical protein